MTITAGLVRQALGQVGDLEAALSEHLANLGDDEILAEDILNDLALVGVPYAGTAAALLPILVAILAQNRSAEPGALAPIGSGRKGSDPWL